MSARRMPIKLLIVGLGALTLLGRIPISGDARRLMLIGWMLAFYWALSIWNSEYRARVFRESLRQERQAETRVIPEFFDADRIVAQKTAYDTEAQIDDIEMV